MDMKRFFLRSFVNLIIIVVIVLAINLGISLFVSAPNQDYANSVTSVGAEKCQSNMLSCFNDYPQLDQEAKQRICGGIYEGCFADTLKNEPFAIYSKNYFMIVASIGLVIMLLGILISIKGYVGVGILIGGFITVGSSIRGLFSTGHGWDNFIVQYSIAVIIALLLLILGIIIYFIKKKDTQNTSK